MGCLAFSARFAQTARPRQISTPLRNLFLALFLTALSLWLSGRVWGYSGHDLMVVGMGWPHILFGFLFYLGRVLRGEPAARTFFLINALLTLTLWIFHYWYTLVALIYIYFLYHAFRDEVFIYLQTRAGHRRAPAVFEMAGAAPLIVLMLLIPQPQDFRHEIRRVELSSEQIARGGWTLIPFAPVSSSRGREFYFSLQAPHSEHSRAILVTYARRQDVDSEGQILINDKDWPRAADLFFKPHFGGQPPAGLESPPNYAEHQPVLLTGGHRVGQTFVAERDQLSGIWLSTRRLERENQGMHLVFRLASPPLLPFSAPWAQLRLALIALFSGVLVWRLRTGWRQNRQFWIYMAVFVLLYVTLHNVQKISQQAGHVTPLLFQFVVVFHYFSWYLFSFDKLRVTGSLPNAHSGSSLYDRLVGCLKNRREFAFAVVLLNLASLAGAFWYAQAGGPGSLRYAFAYDYFLYFLVFHVSFSFGPRHSRKSPSAGLPGRNRALAESSLGCFNRSPVNL